MPVQASDARRNAREAAASFRLPFRRKSWHGTAGNWAGTGLGSSIDFQDHRPYVPGDDPRYIDWQAYARSGSVTMKLYREEVSPAVDLLLDASQSMCFEARKKLRSLELFFFVVESAAAAGSALRCWIVGEGTTSPVSPDSLRDDRWDPFDSPGTSGRLDPARLRLPLRAGSLRLVVSDCLFPSGGERLVERLSASKGQATVMAPTLEAESTPEWSGNLELTDCETGERRIEHFDEERLARYRRAYQRHFELWEESCRRRGVTFVRVRSEGSLGSALKGDALRRGAVEPCH